VSDHAGWLEVCSARGTVFLDEIGELDLPIQVKLLRVLQARHFQRVGETQQREFSGKVVAATNRDLAREIADGRFRSDLYYRLCGDVIHAPSLREQLRDAPQDLERLVGVLCARVADAEEGPALAREVSGWVDAHLGREYAWPGNVRELEQCVRNVLVHGAYTPRAARGAEDSGVAEALAAGTLTADALLRRYCTHVYVRTGSYEEAARRLELDRRTVKAKIDPALLERLRGTRGET
jgi:DNA-binding NtrC family response regulator